MAKSNPLCNCGEDAVCNEKELKCDPCCRCIPQRLCATFEAYGCDCDGVAAYLPIDEDNTYRGEIVCGTQVMDLMVLLHFENQTCYWRVISESFYIDDLFEIGADKQSCERPALTLDVSFSECSGILRIERHEQERLEPRVEPDCGELPWCGSCQCTCKTLCVLISQYMGRRYYGELPGQFASGGSSYIWEGSILALPTSYAVSIELTRDQYTNECIIGGSVDGEELIWQEISGCDSIVVTWQLYDGTRIEIRCKHCSCGTAASCKGCCYRMEFNPTYPNGYVPNVPFAISAPTCSELDGVTGEFLRSSPTSPPQGICGACEPMVGIGVPAPLGILKYVLGESCFSTPCSVHICLVLTCEEGELPIDGLDPCCSRLRLWIGTNFPQVGDIGEQPPVEGTCGMAAVSWRKVQPIACLCEGGLMARFPLNIVIRDDVFEYGICEGMPLYCQMLLCALTDAELTI